MRAGLSAGLALLALAASWDAWAQSGPTQAQCIARPTRACVSALAIVPSNDLAGIETRFHVAEAQFGAADLKAAARTLAQAKLAAAALPDEARRRDALAALAVSDIVLKAAEQATAGQRAEAMKTLKAIAEQAEESEYISLLFAELAEGHARLGNASAAAETMAVAAALTVTVEDEDIRLMTQADVAVRQAAVEAHAGKAEEARATATSLQGNMRRDAFNRIVEATAVSQARSGQAARALGTAAAIEDTGMRIDALCAVADAHSLAGRSTEAADATHRAADSALALPAASDAYGEAIARIVRSEVKAGRLAVAMTLATGLMDAVWRTVALDAIAAAAPE